LGLSGREHKLHVEAVRFVYLHDCAQVAATQAVLREVSVKDDGIEQREVHVLSPGMAVTNLGTSSPWRRLQTVTIEREAPEGPTRVAVISNLLPKRLNLPSRTWP
jgi:hypothetical protein